MYTAVYLNPFDRLYNLMDVGSIIDMEEIYAELLDEKAVQGVIISSTDGIPINYLFKGKKPSNMLNSAHNPMSNNGIPKIKEPNTMCSPMTFPPCTPDSLKYLSDIMTVLSSFDVFLFIFFLPLI